MKWIVVSPGRYRLVEDDHEGEAVVYNKKPPRGKIYSYYSTRSKQERKLDNYSPEEVLSGRQYGVKNAWGKTKSKEDFNKEHRRQRKDLSESLR